MRALLCVAAVSLGCQRAAEAPAVSASPTTGVGPGERGTWQCNGRVYTGVRDIANAPAPTEVWVAPSEISSTRRLAGFTQQEPSGCAQEAIPDPAQWAAVQKALADEASPDGAFEVVATGDGCARLVELRQGGDVQRWEWRRFTTADGWKTRITWDFDAHVRRPTTIDRFSLTVALNRYGEWAKDELHRKRFGDFVYTHYRGEAALYAEQRGATPQRISSDTVTVSCRTDGSNHCDSMEREAHWRFDNPY
ncbi:MAG: hypothetical protein QM817_27180 [Archangium sp.]